MASQKYRILVDYETGNPFGHEEKQQHLEYIFDSVASAKAAMARIKEHYDWYESVHGIGRYRDKKIDRPAWHLDEFGNLSDWDAQYMVSFYVDEAQAKRVQLSAFWVGYFERLIALEVVPDFPNPELRIEF